MQTNTIKGILARYPEMQAAQLTLESLSPDTGLEEISRLRKQMNIVEAWLSLLTEEERFVVEKHIIGKLPWPMVFVEYGKQWDGAIIRHERTLKQFQADALAKIAQFIRQRSITAETTALFFSIS